MDWLVTVWERYLELCVEQDIWKGNAVAFLKDRTGKPEEEIISFVETSWDKCQAYTDNLKAFLGKIKTGKYGYSLSRWTNLNVTFRPGKSSLITKITRNAG